MQTSSAHGTATRLGCELAYWSDGEGPPVLMIQGTGVHGEGWRPQIDGLRGELRCAWFDNRGMGASVPRGSAPITMEQLALDAFAVMDALGWAEAHLVGHSLGGCIALEAALLQPGRVRSLAVLCSAADGRGLTRMNASMMWRALRMQVGTKRSRRRAFLEMVLTQEERSGSDLDELALSLAPIFGHDLAESPPIVMRQVRAMSRWNALPRVSDLAAIPTLLVGAEEDVIARPELVRATADAMPAARYVQVPGAHGVPITAPDVVNDLLRRHFAAVEDGAPD